MENQERIEVFFDGACPICSREMAMVRRMDRQCSIQFTDIAARDFDAQAQGLDALAVKSAIHARLDNGTVITGVEVFRRLYSAVGFQRLVAWSRRPWIARLLDAGYAAFARNRHWLTTR